MSPEAQAKLRETVAQALAAEIARQAADPKIGAVFDGDLAGLADAALAARKRYFAGRGLIKGEKE